MNPRKQLEPDRYARELTLLEQVHLALGLPTKLDDFYLITASLMLDPAIVGLSRVYFLRFDERTQTFSGRLALGARNAKEHRSFRRDLQEETRQLKLQMEKAYRENPDPRTFQTLYNLRFHSLWINVLQGREEGTGINSEFQEVTLRRESLPDNHVIVLAANDPQARFHPAEELSLEQLVEFLKPPVATGRLVSKRGLHGIFLGDTCFETKPADSEALYHFQWLLNHASFTLDNVELVEELTATTQRLQEVDRLKSNFLSIVSHELRTPLTSIIGFVHLLKDEKLGSLLSGQMDLLQRVAGHSAHLQSIINDLLEIAEVEAGGILNVQLGPMDPLGPLMAVIPKVETRRGTREITIEPILTEAVPEIIADPNALERILYHLLDNAVKFIPGKGRVEIEFKRADDKLDITVADSGIGIPQDHLKRIFDYFYQVDFRLERSYGGMGIGLTVVKLLLDATEGQIHVESAPGVGSRFTLSYPLATFSK